MPLLFTLRAGGYGTIRALTIAYKSYANLCMYTTYKTQLLPSTNIIHKMDPAIARAVFTSALLRADADAPEIRREDAASFTKALIKVTNICSNREMKVRVD